MAEVVINDSERIICPQCSGLQVENYDGLRYCHGCGNWWRPGKGEE